VDGVTGEPVVWRTDEPCPVCAAGLFLVGHGEPVQVAECRLCGWSERWELATDVSNGNGNGGDAR
jgi:ribosomal protein S27AE